ncbi:methyltransferase family protein [Nocardia tenerifensis]|uniref:Methyltransferase family protein n=1 Tax=Nocardia tenerifensis TaxID=228006 RepID=A0A318KAB4_9NOCA|nr:class I SAM-dependent methyltransferase [Nocardia tenerifensis]PXX71501.1 methyltransferase family protein [Nocardia tenerifensis]
MDRDTLSWYESHAEHYIARTDSFEFFDGLEQDLLAFTHLLRVGAVVADLGSGAGRDARRIAEAGHSVIAVDASLALLRRCVAAAGTARPLLGVNADLLALPFVADSIDGIWACGSLLHLRNEEIPVVLRQCFASLRPGAPIGVSMKEGAGSERRSDGRYFTYTSALEMAGWLETAGFEGVSVSGPSRNEWLLAVAMKPGGN